jgi:hypothetical protein
VKCNYLAEKTLILEAPPYYIEHSRIESIYQETLRFNVDDYILTEESFFDGLKTGFGKVLETLLKFVRGFVSILGRVINWIKEFLVGLVRKIRGNKEKDTQVRVKNSPDAKIFIPKSESIIRNVKRAEQVVDNLKNTRTGNSNVRSSSVHSNVNYSNNTKSINNRSERLYLSSPQKLLGSSQHQSQNDPVKERVRTEVQETLNGFESLYDISNLERLNLSGLTDTEVFQRIGKTTEKLDEAFKAMLSLQKKISNELVGLRKKEKELTALRRELYKKSEEIGLTPEENNMRNNAISQLDSLDFSIGILSSLITKCYNSSSKMVKDIKHMNEFSSIFAGIKERVISSTRIIRSIDGRNLVKDISNNRTEKSGTLVPNDWAKNWYGSDMVSLFSNLSAFLEYPTTDGRVFFDVDINSWKGKDSFGNLGPASHSNIEGSMESDSEAFNLMQIINKTYETGIYNECIIKKGAKARSIVIQGNHYKRHKDEIDKNIESINGLPVYILEDNGDKTKLK